MKAIPQTFGAVEIITFKLNNCTCQQFIAANDDVDAFLKGQQGFVSRSILELKSGSITDMLVWDTVESGTNAIHKLMSELSDSPVHSMIDQSTVSWSITPIAHYIKQTG